VISAIRRYTHSICNFPRTWATYLLRRIRSDRWSKGIPGEPPKSENLGQWIHSLATLAAKPFLTTSLYAPENTATLLFVRFPHRSVMG
jgi:hypothetical protein